jgi:hypothetical protein
MTFDEAINPDQEFELEKNDLSGSIEYSTKQVTFNNIHNLSIYFNQNFGAETTRLYYIGLRGEWSEAHYHGVTLCTYESMPQMEDHKNLLKDNVNHQIS